MILIRWFLNALFLYIISYIVPGISFANWWSLLVTVLVLGLLNAMIRPLMLILTLPINLLTLGLFTLVVNGFIFWLASTMVKGFEAQSFAAAFLGALIYSIITSVISMIENRPKIARLTRVKK